MLIGNERIKAIIWGFDDEKLFYSLDRNGRRRYDIPASALNYSRLCKARLEQTYPKANIQIIYRLNLSDQEELLPYDAKTDIEYDTEGDDFELYAESDDIESIEGICDKVCTERWEEPKDWHSLAELSKRFKIPTGISRLACQTKLITDMWIDESVWKVLRKDFVDFSEKIKLHLNHEILSVRSDDSESYSVQGMSVADLSGHQSVSLPNVNYWLVKSDWLKLPTVFKSHNSIITIQLDQSHLFLTLHFFNTGEPLVEIGRTFMAFADALILQASEYLLVEATLQEYQYLNEYTESIQINFKCALNQRQSLSELIEQCAEQLRQMTQDTQIFLEGGIKWSPIYEKKPEDRFRREVLEPLLRHMNYVDVRNRHGTDEHGRDFTFSDQTRFGEPLHYGLQAKAGRISGKANKDIETLLSQIKRAFDMPYYEPPYSAEKKYISIFIIAISGDFTKEAQKIIQELLPKSQLGSVFFWDKTKIKNLINDIWPQERTK